MTIYRGEPLYPEEEGAPNNDHKWVKYLDKSQPYFDAKVEPVTPYDRIDHILNKVLETQNTINEILTILLEEKKL